MARGLHCSNLPPGWGLGELLLRWPLMPGCETGCSARLFGGGCAVCSTCAHLARASFVLGVLRKQLGKSSSLRQGQHPSGVTGGNIIFLGRSAWRQQRFCLGAGSSLV